MAKKKTTLTIDTDDLEEARRLSGAPTRTATVSIALRELIRSQRLRTDLAAYGITGPTDAEIALAGTSVDHRDLVDDTDWESLYEDDSR